MKKRRFIDLEKDRNKTSREIDSIQNYLESKKEYEFKEPISIKVNKDGVYYSDDTPLIIQLKKQKLEMLNQRYQLINIIMNFFNSEFIINSAFDNYSLLFDFKEVKRKTVKIRHFLHETEEISFTDYIWEDDNSSIIIGKSYNDILHKTERIIKKMSFTYKGTKKLKDLIDNNMIEMKQLYTIDEGNINYYLSRLSEEEYIKLKKDLGEEID